MKMVICNILKQAAHMQSDIDEEAFMQQSQTQTTWHLEKSYQPDNSPISPTTTTAGRMNTELLNPCSMGPSGPAPARSTIAPVKLEENDLLPLGSIIYPI